MKRLFKRLISFSCIFGMSLISILGLAIVAPKKKERGNGER